MFYIETILDHRKLRNRWEFLVKWENFPNSENTWEPYSNIKDALPWAYHNYDKIKDLLPKNVEENVKLNLLKIIIMKKNKKKPKT